MADALRRARAATRAVLARVRVGSGIACDVRGRLPHYADDWVQGINCGIRCHPPSQVSPCTIRSGLRCTCSLRRRSQAVRNGLMRFVMICHKTVQGHRSPTAVMHANLAFKYTTKTVLCVGSSLLRCTFSSAAPSRRSRSASSSPKPQMGYAALAVASLCFPVCRPQADRLTAALRVQSPVACTCLRADVKKQ